MGTVKLTSCPKLPCGRSVEPEETVSRLQALLRAKYDYWVHQEQVDARLHWSALFIEELEFRAMGKGVTAMLSHAGALAEAAEWLLCRKMEQLPGYEEASDDAWEGQPHLSLESLLAHVATATPPVMEQIRALPAARQWADGWSLMHDTSVKVPIGYVDIINGPNGKAAGNTLEEAIEHAVLEIFERRAHITVLRNRLVMPTIDPGTVQDPLVHELWDFLRARDIEVTLKDLSFGGALPCLGAYFFDPHIPEDAQFHHFFKVGASFNGVEALTRIFTEYTQGRARDEFLQGDGGDWTQILRHDFRKLRVMPEEDDNFLSAFMFGFVPYREAGFLRDGDVAPFNPGPCPRDSLEDIRLAQSICETMGKDFVVVDFSDPTIDFAVVRVVIPGYSDVLPFHPARSHGLFRPLTRSEVIAWYSDQPPN